MNIYLVKRTDNWSWDDYDSFIVAAPDEETARLAYPSNVDPDNAPVAWDHEYKAWFRTYSEGSRHRVNQYSGWVDDLSKVDVNLLGTAAPGITGVLLASFNAG